MKRLISPSTETPNGAFLHETFYGWDGIQETAEAEDSCSSAFPLYRSWTKSVIFKNHMKLVVQLPSDTSAHGVSVTTAAFCFSYIQTE